MGTTTEKIAYLVETKRLIKNAIVDKGPSISEDDTFRSYTDKIAEISGGGGGGDTGKNVCDNIPHVNFYPGGSGDTTIYYKVDALTCNYIVPLKADSMYCVIIKVPGNRLRIVTSDFNPAEITSNRAGIRNLYSTNSPVALSSCAFVAQSTEKYLTVYYTNQKDTDVDIRVYEFNS